MLKCIRRYPCEMIHFESGVLNPALRLDVDRNFSLNLPAFKVANRGGGFAEGIALVDEGGNFPASMRSLKVARSS